MSTYRPPVPPCGFPHPQHTHSHALALAGDVEIDVKSFQNVLMVAVIMALIGVALSLGGIEDATAAARAGAKGKTTKTGATPKKKASK